MRLHWILVMVISCGVTSDCFGLRFEAHNKNEKKTSRGSFRKIPKGGGGAKTRRKTFWGGVCIVRIQF